MIYDDAGNFKNGVAEVMRDGESYVIDTKVQERLDTST